MGYNKQTEASKVKQIIGNTELPLSSVMLESSFRAGYGSTEDIALEDRYISTFGGKVPKTSIKPERGCWC